MTSPPLPVFLSTLGLLMSATCSSSSAAAALATSRVASSRRPVVRRASFGCGDNNRTLLVLSRGSGHVWAPGMGGCCSALGRGERGREGSM